MTAVSDLGPLLAAVTDEWELSKTIAKRAGVDARGAGAKLAALARQSFVVTALQSSERIAERVLLYRRGPNAPARP